MIVNDNNSGNLNVKSAITLAISFILVEGYFFSPIYFIYKFKNKIISLYELPFAQVFINLLNCLIYTIISLQTIIDKNQSIDIQKIVTNGIGTIICLIVLLSLYITYTKFSNKNLFLYMFTTVNIIFEIIFYALAFYEKSGTKNEDEKEKQNNPLMIVTMVTNSLMYASINIHLYFAIKQKRYDKIPILSSVLGLLASIGWFCYALIRWKEGDDDAQTMIGNAVGIIVLVPPIVTYIFLKIKYGDQFIAVRREETPEEAKERIENLESNLSKESRETLSGFGEGKVEGKKILKRSRKNSAQIERSKEMKMREKLIEENEFIA